MTGDLPRFKEAIERSGPHESSPHPISWRELRRRVGADARRSALLDRLQALCRLMTADLRVPCALIGGSFVQADRSHPKDLDCVLYYAMREAPAVGLEGLQAARRYAAGADIDARFVPLDADPLVLIRMTSFMTSLYHAHRPGARPASPEPGLLLVSLDDCND